MGLRRRLARLEALVPPAPVGSHGKRVAGVEDEVRKCLGALGLDLDQLYARLVAQFGWPSTRRDFFFCLGQVLADRPQAKEAVSQLLLRDLPPVPRPGE